MQNIGKLKAHLRIGNKAFCGEARARVYAGVGNFPNFCNRCLKTIAAEKLEEQGKLNKWQVCFYGIEPDEFWFKQSKS